MRGRLGFAVACAVASAVLVSPRAGAQRAEAAGQTQGGPSETVKALVRRLELEKYKATIKGLTQFGDRRQGTDRNRRAIDWIEGELRSYGCTNTERLRYVYDPARGAGEPPPPRRADGTPTSVGGGRPRGVITPTG